MTLSQIELAVGLCGGDFNTLDIDVVVVRDGKNLIGWVLGFVLGTIGKGVLRKAFEHSVKAIEVRNGTTRGARASQAG
jgi:hypothetical protein